MIPKHWKEEFLKSIKSFDTEEKLDLYFYRPFGFLIAKAALPLKISPTQLTIVGVICGLMAGYYFYHNDSYSNLALAAALFILAGVFDSSDGQLARMGGKSTKLGLVLDGLCDNIVFASVYISSILALAPEYTFGGLIWPIGVLAAICHSCQSALLDFYNREYLYFGYAKTKGDYWNPTLNQARQERAAATSSSDKLFWQLRFSWVWQQNMLCNRSDETRALFHQLVHGSRSEEFQSLYRDHNRLMLRFWRLMGPNFHTILIILCAFLRRFDWYLIWVDIIGLSLALLGLRYFQARNDQALLRSLRQRKLV